MSQSVNESLYQSVCTRLGICTFRGVDTPQVLISATDTHKLEESGATKYTSAAMLTQGHALTTNAELKAGKSTDMLGVLINASRIRLPRETWSCDCIRRQP